jgi:hypothetical protein
LAESISRGDLRRSLFRNGRSAAAAQASIISPQKSDY